MSLTSGRRAAPLGPLVLGLGGLIPFWGLAVGVAIGGAFGLNPLACGRALATYAAIILSFLGGIRWGLAVRDDAGPAAYAISVVPSLIAWTLLVAPEPWRLGGLGIVALLLGPFDLTLVRAGSAPPWFGRLRLILSTGAGIALLFAGYEIR